MTTDYFTFVNVYKNYYYSQTVREARLGYQDESPQLGPRDPSQVNDPESSE